METACSTVSTFYAAKQRDYFNIPHDVHMFCWLIMREVGRIRNPHPRGRNHEVDQRTVTHREVETKSARMAIALSNSKRST